MGFKLFKIFIHKNVQLYSYKILLLFFSTKNYSLNKKDCTIKKKIDIEKLAFSQYVIIRLPYIINTIDTFSNDTNYNKNNDNIINTSTFLSILTKFTKVCGISIWNLYIIYKTVLLNIK